MMTTKNLALLGAFVAVLSLGIYLWLSSGDTARSLTNDVGLSGKPAETVLEGARGAAARMYENDDFRFRLEIPGELTVREYWEGKRTMTITLESVADEKQFQIFVTPYRFDYITPERFRMDVPSGIKTDEVAVVIGGNTATMFFSKHALLGDTREVWFIRDGYLYEVVAKREFDAWLAGIMQGWVFL